MEAQKINFPLGLTFDDILLLPGYTDFSRSDIDLSTRLTRNLRLTLPLVSAPMDTVTESKLAIELARLGGIGIIHRNLSIEDQAKEVKLVKRAHSAGRRSFEEGSGLLVGAAIGAGKDYQDRVKALVSAGVDVVVIDSAHGFTKTMTETVRSIKKLYPKLQIIAGNVSTYEGAKALIDAGADAIRVGMGPGAICTTRMISGMGVPQVTALLETVKAASDAAAAGSKRVPIIADGGIKYSGDMVKALAAGASTVMMGGFFAATIESPGKIVELTREQVPHRFKSIFNDKNADRYKFKEYRGMGSVGAMKKGAAIKSEGEFHGKDYKDRVLVAEGVEGLVPVKGTVKELVDQAVGGIKSGLYYVGAKTISELSKKARFIQITQASLNESHPHSVLITNLGGNY